MGPLGALALTPPQLHFKLLSLPSKGTLRGEGQALQTQTVYPQTPLTYELPAQLPRNSNCDAQYSPFDSFQLQLCADASCATALEPRTIQLCLHTAGANTDDLGTSSSQGPGVGLWAAGAGTGVLLAVAVAMLVSYVQGRKRDEADLRMLREARQPAPLTTPV